MNYLFCVFFNRLHFIALVSPGINRVYVIYPTPELKWGHQILQDVGAAIQGGHDGIELIDVVFVFSNVKLVRELVQDHIRQLEEMGSVSKGQTEGMREMIIAKQKTLYASLSEVEELLERIIDVSITPQARSEGMKNIQLNSEQSRAMIGAIVFAINHMTKFVPGAGIGSGLPESIF
jgi:hypothetical protein